MAVTQATETDIEGERNGVAIAAPTARDGGLLAALVRRLPPLEANTTYCYALLANHFAQTCALARRDRQPVGCVLGYRPPSHTDTLFVWQIGVDQSERGTGLASRMLDAIVARPANHDVRHLEATVTADNRASRRLFARFAAQHDAAVSWRPFLQHRHFAPFEHDAEDLVRVGPFAATDIAEPALAGTRQEAPQ